MSEKVKQIQDGLLKAGRPELSKILMKNWGQDLADYSKSLWLESENQPVLESELIGAFEKEFQRIGIQHEEIHACLNSLQRRRILQTATHLTASEGPTFLALHELALLGLPEKEYYLVASFSGVPFANAAWSGCLNFSTRYELESFIDPKAPDFSELKKADKDRMRDSQKGGYFFDRRISLIPGKMRDALVYQSAIPQKMADLKEYFHGPFQKSVPNAVTGQSFTQWAARFSQKQLNWIHPEKSICYFDVNEVIRHYLIEILKNPSHPISKILFDTEIRKQLFSEFSTEISFFSVVVEYKNNQKHELLKLEDEALVSQNYRLFHSASNIIDALEKGILCPGLFLTFGILSFINGLTCLGSFEQVEYLASYKRKWLDMDFLDKDVVKNVKTNALTCGRCVDEAGQLVFPLDLLQGLDWDFPENQTLGELMNPLIRRFGVTV